MIVGWEIIHGQLGRSRMAGLRYLASMQFGKSYLVFGDTADSLGCQKQKLGRPKADHGVRSGHYLSKIDLQILDISGIASHWFSVEISNISFHCAAEAPVTRAKNDIAPKVTS